MSADCFQKIFSSMLKIIFYFLNIIPKLIKICFSLTTKYNDYLELFKLDSLFLRYGGHTNARLQNVL